MTTLTEAEKKIFFQITPMLRSLSFGSEVNSHFVDTNELELKRIATGNLIELPVVNLDLTIPQACHVVSTYLWLTGQVDYLCTGFALVEEEIVSSTWYQHSFCIKDDKIIEPTPLLRDKYFGVKLDLNGCVDLCLDTVVWFKEWEELNLSRAQIETINRYLLLAKGA